MPRPVLVVLASAILVVAAGCTTDPNLAATGSIARYTDGFRSRSGAVIGDHHVVVDAEVIAGADKVDVRVGADKPQKLRVMKKDAGTGLALLYDAMAKFPGPKVGSTDAIDNGAKVFAATYKDGKPVAIPGTVSGWRYHEGRAYIETDLKLGEAGRGTGVFDESGSLIGFYRFSRSPKLNYVLPIEYATGVPKAVAHGVAGSAGTEAFKVRWDEGKKHPAPLPPPQDFATLVPEYSWSATALVGYFMALEKKDGGTIADGVKFQIAARESGGELAELATGTLEKDHAAWVPQPEEAKVRAGDLVKAYGQDFVDAEFTPHVYGHLRYRVPFGMFCDKARPEGDHMLTLTTGDGRVSEAMPFRGLAEICKGDQPADGSGWEKEWGMKVEAPKAAPAPKGKKKKKKKKKKKR